MWPGNTVRRAGIEASVVEPLLQWSLLRSVLLAVGQLQVPTTITPDGTLSTMVAQRATVYDITGGTRPGN